MPSHDLIVQPPRGEIGYPTDVRYYLFIFFSMPEENCAAAYDPGIHSIGRTLGKMAEKQPSELDSLAK